RLRSLIREVPDFPHEGILFRDITPLLADPEGLRAAVDAIASVHRGEPIDVVAGIESRGFILGAGVALSLGAGFVPVRKAGRLPAETIDESYELEYGRAGLEVHADAGRRGRRVLDVDA